MANGFIFAASTVGMALGLLSLAALPVAGQVTNTGATSDRTRRQMDILTSREPTTWPR
jgi:hypothetical protein